ncbi:MAG: STAS domain-containing protein [Magnetococcus sp. YQC-5]
MIDFHVDNSGIGTLVLSGSLTIQQALSLQEILLQAVGEGNQLAINVEQVETLDLTALQLLCAAHRSLIKNGKKVTREGAIPEIVHRIVRESGFLGCLDTGDDIGLWMGTSV